ncbi:MAG: uroporphyrinogen decarboxylase family protein [Caldilineales bacterium]|nr:uroporphyrinogen decarboxylase family protein [Caldilineales bacterium]MCX7851604.1 uroporphyrinogen decarboxylase family protein [Caldilineales bacterium]
MTPRERVLAAINHEEPDRVPICIGVSNATSMKMKPYRALKALLGIEAPDAYVYDWPELGTALPDEATMRRLHSDVRGVLDLEPEHIRARNKARPPHTPYIDSWGSGQVELTEDVWFPGVHPLADATTIEEIENYPWPDMNDPTRVAHVRAQAQKLRDEGEYAIMGTPWLLFPFERAHAMQGLDRFMMNMVHHPDFAAALLRKITDVCKVLMGNFLRECGDLIDIIKIGDDLGTQSGLMISPKMYRRFLKPLHAEFIAFIKERTDAKVFFHTDGDVFDLIPDFIEIGVDILNPIQTSAGRMANLEELKRRYGQHMVFCGAIDTHRILPYGTPEEVRQEVRRVINILGPGGGYMVASVHTIMNDVPPENILAMVDAVEEFGYYPLGR